jgi:hypothetical protein
MRHLSLAATIAKLGSIICSTPSEEEIIAGNWTLRKIELVAQ